jgi:hypothetical protein
VISRNSTSAKKVGSTHVALGVLIGFRLDCASVSSLQIRIGHHEDTIESRYAVLEGAAELDDRPDGAHDGRDQTDTSRQPDCGRHASASAAEVPPLTKGPTPQSVADDFRKKKRHFSDMAQCLTWVRCTDNSGTSPPIRLCMAASGAKPSFTCMSVLGGGERTCHTVPETETAIGAERSKSHLVSASGGSADVTLEPFQRSGRSPQLEEVRGLMKVRTTCGY